jgi:hypothetical protein
MTIVLADTPLKSINEWLNLNFKEWFNELNLKMIIIPISTFLCRECRLCFYSGTSQGQNQSGMSRSINVIFTLVGYSDP